MVAGVQALPVVFAYGGNNRHHAVYSGHPFAEHFWCRNTSYIRAGLIDSREFARCPGILVAGRSGYNDKPDWVNNA